MILGRIELIKTYSINQYAARIEEMLEKFPNSKMDFSNTEIVFISQPMVTQKPGKSEET